MKISPSLLSLTAAVALLATGGAATAGPVTWDRYMTSAANVAAIASAVASVGNCSKPLEFDELEEDGKVYLTVNCNGDEDEEAAVIIEFQDLGDLLLPMGFQYAG